MLRSLQAARDMYARDRSVSASVSTGWFEWHSEFDASHAAATRIRAAGTAQE